MHSVETKNFHPDKTALYNKFPLMIRDLPNIIFYGPTGVGKYSQVLQFLKRYSPSQLKYEKKMELETEKQKYKYKISDIHYEIDMSLLGCNSKLLWHEIICQIVEIISNNIKTEKVGFVVCKNFHGIHNELLDIFYSYIQQYRNQTTSHVLIRFIIITESVGFIPKNILQCCQTISFSRPSKTQYLLSADAGESSVLDSIQSENIVNSKEIKSFHLIDSADQLPMDVFNVVCNQILHEILHPDKMQYMDFRDKIYDILIYNLDAIECIWCIFSSIISLNLLSKEDVSCVVDKIFVFLKYYNNNYRPIYHLESIFFTIITKIHEQV